MASLLARGTAAWRALTHTMITAGSTSSHSTPSLSASSFFPAYRPLATLGRAGRPTKPAAASPVAAAASATEKKPASAYALYVKQEFPKAKAQAGADAKFADVSKTVSGQWKSLNQTEKSKYQSAYASAKQEWDKKYPQGSAPTPTKKAAASTATAATPKPAAKKARLPKGERKPPSGYALFVKQQFANYKKEGESAPQTMKVLAGHWKALSDTDKAKYKVAA